jgi:hypothetical protein
MGVKNILKRVNRSTHEYHMSHAILKKKKTFTFVPLTPTTMNASLYEIMFNHVK